MTFQDYATESIFTYDIRAIPDLSMRSEPARSTIISLLLHIMEGFDVLPTGVMLPFSFNKADFFPFTDLFTCTCKQRKAHTQ